MSTSAPTIRDARSVTARVDGDVVDDGRGAIAVELVQASYMRTARGGWTVHVYMNGRREHDGKPASATATGPDYLDAGWVRAFVDEHAPDAPDCWACAPSVDTPVPDVAGGSVDTQR